MGHCWLCVKYGDDSSKSIPDHVSSEDEKAKEKR